MPQFSCVPAAATFRIWAHHQRKVPQMPARVLIVNGNMRAANERMVSLGGVPYGEGYAAALRHFEPDLDCTVLRAAERVSPTSTRRS